LQEKLIPPRPPVGGTHGVAHPQIHVGIPQQNVPFNEELFDGAGAQVAVYELGGALEGICVDSDGVEGDVARDDRRGASDHAPQLFHAGKAKLPGPVTQPLLFAAAVGVSNRYLEGVDCESDDGRARVVLAPLVA
jgi:hypothetical protein